MAVEETKQDLTLRRVQVTIAILVGLTGLILGVYNIKKSILSKEEPAKTPTIIVQQVAPQTGAEAGGPSRVREAIDEVGASWIKKLGEAKSTSSSEPTQ